MVLTVTGKYLIFVFFGLMLTFQSKTADGNVGTVSSPNHIFSQASLSQRLTSTLCTYFRLYYTAIQLLYRNVVCNVPVFCKANVDRNQLWSWLDSDP